MSPRTRSLGGFVLLELVWAYNWIVSKNALAYVGAFDFAAYRSLLGSVTLFGVMLCTGRLAPLPPFGPSLLLGLLQTTGFMLLMTLALLGGGAGKVAVLAFTMPFWTLLWARIFLAEQIVGGQWLAILLAAAGLLAILDPLHMHGSMLSKFLAVSAGACWAAATVYAKLLRGRMRFDVLTLTGWQMALGTIPLFIACWTVPQQPLQPEPYFWFALFYSGVLASGLGWLMWMRLLQHLSAGAASLNALAIPAVAVLAAWLEHGERPAPHELLGMLLVALALVLLSYLAAQREKIGEAPA